MCSSSSPRRCTAPPTTSTSSSGKKQQSDNNQQDQPPPLKSHGKDPTRKQIVHQKVLTEASIRVPSHSSPTNRSTGRRLKRQHPESSPSKTRDEGDVDQNDHVHEEGTILYGFDISNFHPSSQFKLLVGTIFGFHAIYGYLQELLSIHIADRKFTLFISVIQLFGYAFWSWVLDCIRKRNLNLKLTTRTSKTTSSSTHGHEMDESFIESGIRQSHQGYELKKKPPFAIFIFMSFLRLVEVVMTNAATIYINFPMKTLMKSSKVSFTMLGGMTMGKKYRRRDFVAVVMLIFGLGVFIYADMRSATVLFRPAGVAMLVSAPYMYRIESCTVHIYIFGPSHSH